MDLLLGAGVPTRRPGALRPTEGHCMSGPDQDFRDSPDWELEGAWDIILV